MNQNFPCDFNIFTGKNGTKSRSLHFLYIIIYKNNSLLLNSEDRSAVFI